MIDPYTNALYNSYLTQIFIITKIILFIYTHILFKERLIKFNTISIQEIIRVFLSGVDR